MNRKCCLKKQDQRNLRLPLWPELSIGRVWPEAVRLDEFNEYMPSEWSLLNVKKIERNYMFGVLISLAPLYVETLVSDIRSQRNNQQAGRVVRPQTIGVSQDWVNQLLAQPFRTSKCTA